MDSPLMSLGQVATYLGVSNTTIYRYVKRKKIPSLKIGRIWKFRKEKIDAWLEKQENARS